MNILIVDDQTMLRTGMEHFLHTLSEDYRLYQAANLDDARNILNTNPVQLVISEIHLGGTIGAALLNFFRDIDPGLSVLFYSAFSERLYALTLMRAGANGFISKQSRLKELAKAISTVASGGKYMSVELQASLLLQIDAGPKRTYPESPRLSRRESLIMSHVIRGKSNKEIAFALNLKSNTISTYKKRIYIKMNVADKFELFQKAVIHLMDAPIGLHGSEKMDHYQY